MRGGFFPIHLAVLLNGEGFPDVSPAAIGAWVRLRALGEFTGQPVTTKALAKVGVTPAMLDELYSMNLISKMDGAFEAIGMPGIPRKPSDEPEATRLRKARERENQRRNPSESNPIQSSVTPSRVTGRDTQNDGSLKDADDRAAEAYFLSICRRCHQSGDESNPVVQREQGPAHLFDPCPSIAVPA